MINHPDHERTILIKPAQLLLSEIDNFQTRFLSEYDGETVQSINQRIECFPLETSEEKLRFWLERETQTSIEKMKPVNVTREEFPD